MALGDFTKNFLGGGGSNNTGSSTSTSSGQGLVPSFSELLKAYDTAPEMQGMMQSYFGLDPGEVPLMTPEKLAELADKAQQAKFFSDNIEKIEEHIKVYIQGVVNYNQFVASCVKAGVAGMKKIDKATLDVFLEWKGYDVNRQKLAEQSRTETAKLAQELSDYIALENTKLNVFLQISAADSQRKIQEQEAFPGIKQNTRELSAANQEQQRYLKELIHYGSRAALPASSTPTINIPSIPVSETLLSKVNWFSRIGNFLRGK